MTDALSQNTLNFLAKWGYHAKPGCKDGAAVWRIVPGPSSVPGFMFRGAIIDAETRFPRTEAHLSDDGTASTASAIHGRATHGCR